MKLDVQRAQSFAKFTQLVRAGTKTCNLCLFGLLRMLVRSHV